MVRDLRFHMSPAALLVAFSAVVALGACKHGADSTESGTAPNRADEGGSFSLDVPAADPLPALSIRVGIQPFPEEGLPDDSAVSTLANPTYLALRECAREVDGGIAGPLSLRAIYQPGLDPPLALEAVPGLPGLTAELLDCVRTAHPPALDDPAVADRVVTIEVVAE